MLRQSLFNVAYFLLKLKKVYRLSGDYEKSKRKRKAQLLSCHREEGAILMKLSALSITEKNLGERHIQNTKSSVYYH